MAGPSAATAVEFEDVVRPHLSYLYALAVRLCGNRTSGEDIVQDTLLRAFRGFPRLRNRTQPRLWLTRVLTSAFYDRIRAQQGDEAAGVADEEFDLFDKIVEEDPFPYSDRVHLDFLEIFDDVRVVEVLQQLNPSHRIALILAYVYGFKTREIAEITHKSMGTILAWLFRGRKRLEKELWEYAKGHRLLTSNEEARV